MKNKLRLALTLGLLASPATHGIAQLAKTPPAPEAPPNPPAPIAEPVPPAPPAAQAFAESAIAVAKEAEKAARDAVNQARAFNYQVDVSATASPPSGRTLVIPKDSADVKSLADTEEDLNVMAHILDRAAVGPDGKTRRAMGILVRGPFEMQASPRNVYIEGYGAIFFLGVNYPLSPPAAHSEEAEAKAESPSEWDEARRELYQPPQAGFEFKWPSGSEFKWQELLGPGGGEPYDADRVEQLKKSLIAELKNATHIRSLKPKENVTVIVTGRNPGADRKVAVRKSIGGHASAVTGTARPGGSDNRGNQMILRADKVDVEAFQNDRLSLDEFRKKVTVLVY